MRVAFLALLLFTACGARTSLRVGDDGGGEPGRDAGADAGPTRRDAGTDAGEPLSGCTLGPILGPYTEVAPAFVFSLQRLDESSRYVVGYAHGWPPDERGHVAVFDADRESFERVLSVSGGSVAAAAEGTTGVALVAGVPDHLELMSFDLSTGTGGPTERICEGCFGPSIGAQPIFDGGRVAFAYRTSSDVTVYLDEGGGAAPRTLDLAGESGPALALLPTGGFALVTNPADRTVTTLRYLDADLAPRETVELPIVPVGSPPGLLARDDDVIVVGRADDTGAMHALRVRERVVTPFPLVASESLYTGVALAQSRGVVAIALEGTRANHLVALRADTLTPIGETSTLLDSAAGSSYRRPMTIAPHADGFVIVYGGWHEATFYGLYARKLTCRGFD